MGKGCHSCTRCHLGELPPKTATMPSCHPSCPLHHPQRAAPHPLGLVVGDQLVEGGCFGDLQQDGLGWHVGARGDVAEWAGGGAAPAALALHPHTGRHALGARLGEAGDVLGECQHLGVPLPLL